jgi:hypothetical protein
VGQTDSGSSLRKGAFASRQCPRIWLISVCDSLHEEKITYTGILHEAYTFDASPIFTTDTHDVRLLKLKRF